VSGTHRAATERSQRVFAGGSRQSSRILERGLHAQVVHTLGRDIVDGTLATGQALIPDDLCSRFAVSRSVIRESLRALESLGMVSARPQVGTRVSAEENWDLLNPQVVLWRGEGTQYLRQMHELLELRLGVESAAAELATQRITAEQVDALASAAEAMAAAAQAQDAEGFLEADVSFHDILLRSSGNAIMAQFADTVGAVLRTRSGDTGHTIHDRTGRSIANHRQLAAALRDRDADAARRWARTIVQETLTEFSDRTPRAASL
jgi:DNA-binding FadR family transcriptional regulator